MPARKPTAIHKLHNTERASVRKKRIAEPKPEGDLIEPPAYFTRGQREGWDYVIENAPAYLLKRIDRGTLALYVIAEDNLRLASLDQAERNRTLKHPLLMKTARGAEWRAAPYIAIVEKCATVMLRCAREMGFTPASRTAISIESAESLGGAKSYTANPWSQFKDVA